MKLARVAAPASWLAAAVSATTFQRLGTCPSLGCVLPPDQSDFLPGQLFDLRAEVHAPVNGSEAAFDGRPDADFRLTVARDGGEPVDVARFFAVRQPPLERWRFKWYEDLFAQDRGAPSLVNVASRAYRKLALNCPGRYTVTLHYYGDRKTTAQWVVRPLARAPRAKNVILFIGDGMTTNMVWPPSAPSLALALTRRPPPPLQITAARLLGHRSVNGRYMSRLMMDDFPVVGHQMTHSIDSYITDSANSASALYSGHKSSVNAMGCVALPWPRRAPRRR